jgi:hypothetical protein
MIRVLFLFVSKIISKRTGVARNAREIIRTAKNIPQNPIELNTFKKPLSHGP